MGKLEFLWADYYTKIFCFCVHGGAADLINPGTSLYEHGRGGGREVIYFERRGAELRFCYIDSSYEYSAGYFSFP